MKEWKWKQVSGEILTIVTDEEKGTIDAINEQGENVLHRDRLQSEDLKIIEENFLDIVAETSKYKDFNPMYA
jgi:hypothetical protein